MCGLKPPLKASQFPVTSVTPHVGVWIETSSLLIITAWIGVTPHVGVWIETRLRSSSSRRASVTPHVGVWIETFLQRFI